MDIQISQLQLQNCLSSLIGDGHYITLYDESDYGVMGINGQDGLDKFVSECFFIGNCTIQIDEIDYFSLMLDDEGIVIIDEIKNSIVGNKIKEMFNYK